MLRSHLVEHLSTEVMRMSGKKKERKNEERRENANGEVEKAIRVYVYPMRI